MLKKLIKFVFAGLSNTIFSYLIYLILVIFFNYFISYLLSIFISLLYIYFVNNKFVFQVKSKSKKRFLFFIIYFLQTILNILLLRVWVDSLSINKFFAPLLNIIFISPITFLACNFLNESLSNEKKKFNKYFLK